MNPAEKYAALRALRQGIDAALINAADEVRSFRALFRVRGPQDTDWGTLSTSGGTPTVAYDDAKLLAWAQANEPMLVIAEHQVTVPAAVHPSLKRQLEKRLSIVDGSVVDTTTGEVVDFARVEETTAIVKLIMPEPKKAEAAELVGQHLAHLAELAYPAAVEA